MSGLLAIEAPARQGAGKATEVQRLRDRVEELERLLGISDDSVDRLPLRPQARIIAGMLLRRSICARESLFVALYGMNQESLQPDPRIVDVVLCKLRRALAARGITIENRWGSGWYLTNADKKKLRSWIEEMA